MYRHINKQTNNVMPQMQPYTLEVQWLSTFVLIAILTIVLACYVLPSWTRTNFSRVIIASTRF